MFVAGEVEAFFSFNLYPAFNLHLYVESVRIPYLIVPTCFTISSN
jgi:hypothetical protein